MVFGFATSMMSCREDVGDMDCNIEAGSSRLRQSHRIGGLLKEIVGYNGYHWIMSST